ncbi:MULTISPECIES: cupin domain-containing protein [Kitasatospora]|uniref:cupin domain-containing protein n=1 Tax=Kitasatospora TaxID=2063 RepID=UPI000CB24803|nr:mannose-6-phosphate isomerase-like protein (cupin superfamily) [Kitasatospora sp. GP30]
MTMEIRPLNRDGLTFEYDLYTQRLVPWPLLNAPFEGCWSIVEPGTSSRPHEHHEYEIWIAAKGEGEIEADGVRRPFKAGDVVHFTPHTEHFALNPKGADGNLEFYSIWWDTELAVAFLDRHQASAE